MSGRMGIYSQAHVPYDADADAFNTAASITGTTQRSAITSLTLDLKGTGSTTNSSDIWSKLYAFYPMCPIDATTFNLTACKYNLVDPVDTDAAFRMTWVNSPTVSYDGVKGNGSTSYGNTHFIESAHMTAGNNGMTRDNFDISSGTDDIIAGASYPMLSFRRATQSFSGNNSIIHADARNICTISRLTATDFTVYLDGASGGTLSATTTSQASKEMFICASSHATNTSPVSPLAVGFKTFSLHDGLTANEALDLKDAITNYNTALGR